MVPSDSIKKGGGGSERGSVDEIVSVTKRVADKNETNGTICRTNETSSKIQEKMRQGASTDRRTGRVRTPRIPELELAIPSPRNYQVAGSEESDALHRSIVHTNLLRDAVGGGLA